MPLKQVPITNQAQPQLDAIVKKRKDARAPNRSNIDVVAEAITLLYKKEMK